MNQISPVILFSLLCCVWPALWFVAGWWLHGHRIMIVSHTMAPPSGRAAKAPYVAPPRQ